MEAHEAKVLVTYGGVTGDLREPVPYDIDEAVLRRVVEEAIRSGTCPGIGADENVNLTNYMIDRSGPNEARPFNLLTVRPKTPFG